MLIGNAPDATDNRGYYHRLRRPSGVREERRQIQQQVPRSHRGYSKARPAIEGNAIEGTLAHAAIEGTAATTIVPPTAEGTAIDHRGYCHLPRYRSSRVLPSSALSAIEGTASYHRGYGHPSRYRPSRVLPSIAPSRHRAIDHRGYCHRPSTIKGTAVDHRGCCHPSRHDTLPIRHPSDQTRLIGSA